MNGTQQTSKSSLPYPKPTSLAARTRMRSNRRVDTKPEVELRSLLHRKGLRFRKDYLIRLPHRRRVYADVAFTKKKVAVFVDGCFWHSCPQHGTTPKSNQDYWIPKLRENVERDRLADRSLRDSGWAVIRVWEHTAPLEALETVLDSFYQRSQFGISSGR